MGQLRFVQEAPSQARQTSKDAARAIEPHLGRLQQAVLAAISSSADGATDREVQAWLKMKGSTERPRRIELLRAGLIRDSGTKRERSTVWVAKNEQ